MKKYGIVLSMAMLTLILSKCKNDRFEVLDAKKYNCDTIVPSYSNDIVPIIITYCSDSTFGNCHQNNSQNVQLNNYSELKFLVDGGHIQEHVINRHEMPPPYTLGPKTLPQEMIQKIDCWIKRGAAND